jgi:hypothetical protein
VNNPVLRGVPRTTLFPPSSMRSHPRLPLLGLAACAVGLAGCVSVRTEPIEVKPIHITVDVNVKVERALDDFFGGLDAQSQTVTHDQPKETKP